MTILYFGIYNPDFSRNKVYIAGLREEGITVIECRDTSPGIVKYWRLWSKYRVSGAHDAVVVGYPGHVVVPFARLISRKPIIADLLGSLADAESNSRDLGQLRRLKNTLIDWFAVRCADIILLESESQKAFFQDQFGSSGKYRVLYTGAEQTTFYCNSDLKQDSQLVLFRGRLTPESGVTYILEAARLLKDEGIRVRIIGFGQLLNTVREIIARDGLTNVELIADLLPERELRRQMCEASISLGQFENNPRLTRTIPHKAYESLAMGIPYVSGDAPAIREIIRDNETGFLVPLADPRALAEKIRVLLNDPVTLVRVGAAGERAYHEHFSPLPLAQNLLRFIADK